MRLSCIARISNHTNKLPRFHTITRGNHDAEFLEMCHQDINPFTCNHQMITGYVFSIPVGWSLVIMAILFFADFSLTRTKHGVRINLIL